MIIDDCSIMDVASSHIPSTGHLLVSGDVTGCLNTWLLDTDHETTLVSRHRIADWRGESVTTLAIWSKYKDGVLVAGYGSGETTEQDE